MKKLLLLVASLAIVFTLTACNDLCVGPECEVGSGSTTTDDNALTFTHINGEGHETEKRAYVLFEWEGRDYVKYQITYLSCTCRPADYNYWQVMYVEVNKFTNDIRSISFTDFGDEGHEYTVGLWGDSSPTPAGKTLEDFQADYFPWYIGKSLEDLQGMSVFTNDDYFGVQNETTIDDTDLIDSFAGSSVSTNNMLRAMKTLLQYHVDNYDE